MTVVDPIPASLRRQIPAMVAAELDAMSETEYGAWAEEYARHMKSTGAGYTLWLFFGWHYAYLGKWGVQVLFWLSFGGLLFWWLADLFRVGGMVGDHNRDVAVRVLRDQRALTVR